MDQLAGLFYVLGTQILMVGHGFGDELIRTALPYCVDNLLFEIRLAIKPFTCQPIQASQRPQDGHSQLRANVA